MIDAFLDLQEKANALGSAILETKPGKFFISILDWLKQNVTG